MIKTHNVAQAIANIHIRKDQSLRMKMIVDNRNKKRNEK